VDAISPTLIPIPATLPPTKPVGPCAGWWEEDPAEGREREAFFDGLGRVGKLSVEEGAGGVRVKAEEEGRPDLLLLLLLLLLLFPPPPELAQDPEKLPTTRATLVVEGTFGAWDVFLPALVAVAVAVAVAAPPFSTG